MSSVLKDMPIKLKVALAPGIAMACLIVIGLIGLWGNRTLGDTVNEIGGRSLPRVVEMGALDRDIRSIAIDMSKTLAWEGAGFKAANIAVLDQSIQKQLAALEVSLKTQADAITDPAAKPHWTKLIADYRKYRKAAAETLDVKTDGPASAASYMLQLDDGFKAMMASVDALIDNEGSASRHSVEHAQSMVENNKKMIGTAFVLGLVITLAFSIGMARLISRPLTDSARMARSMAGGDLTVQPSEEPSRDASGEVLRELHAVASGLNGLVTEIRRTADSVDLASTEIAGGNSDLSSRTESTAAALQQTASSIEELSANIRASADNAREANRLAQSASDVAREGSAVVGDVVSRMESIDASARKIGEIIGVIDAIAFQTNILALNAAVEAARAGEQGRGFNVVATEVRALARRSSDSAREIRTLISASIEQIGGGVARVRDAGDTMQRVVAAATKVSTTIESISLAATEQAAGITQVSHAVAAMDSDTQRNAALVEEASAATDSMSEQARSLVTLLSRFRVTA